MSKIQNEEKRLLILILAIVLVAIFYIVLAFYTGKSIGMQNCQ